MAKKEKLSLEELLEQALVKDEDKPYEVPGNWVWTRLGAVISLQGGGTPSKAVGEFWNGSILWASVKEIKDRYLTQTEDSITELGFQNSSTFLAVPGDVILVTRISPGKSSIASVDVAINQDLKVVKKKLPINSVFLWGYFTLMISEIENMASGTTVKGITTEKVHSLPFPLPPLSEQQRIVDIIESLFEKLDRAKELAQHALDSFENRKSAILHKAFTGELTRKWRGENEIDCGDDIVEELYNYRIGLAKTSVERDKVEIIFKYQEHQDNGRLPAFWRYVTLEKLCKSFQYGTSKRSDNRGEVVVLRMGNLQSGKIDWSNLAYTSVEEDIIKYSLKNGDVLFNRTNSPELVGKTSIYEGERPAIFAGYLIRINNLNYLDSYYLNYAMNTSFAKDYCMNVKSDGVNQSNINAQKLAKFEIPFCSLKEQKEIVRILNNLLANEQKAKELCDVIDKIDHMKKAILARAFRGELGTNNPGEESALELLKAVLKEKV